MRRQNRIDGEGLDMRPAAGEVDIWHWKTSRSEPLGHVADQVSSPAAGRVDDAGMGIEHRNRPAGGNDRSGPAFEWDGTTQAYERWDGASIMLDPAYVLLGGHQIPFEGDTAAGQVIYAASCAGCHGTMGQGGFGPALTARELARDTRAELTMEMAATTHPGASAFNGLTAEGQTDVLARLRGFSGVPGYFLTTPEGSVADLTTQSAPRDHRVTLLEQYGCGPIHFSASGDALYERHLIFDNVVAPAAAGSRERYEAITCTWPTCGRTSRRISAWWNGTPTRTAGRVRPS